MHPSMSPSPSSSNTDAAPWPSVWRGVLVVVLLLGASTLSFVDRQILSLFVDPLRRSLQISDLQISLLQGVAFAIFYAIAGLPIGYLVDRGSRKLIIIAGVVFWSLMTVLCGFATGFLGLFIARMGVGLGEAALGPAAWSILADYFPPDRLPLVLSIFGIGTSVGAGLSFIVGGMVSQWAEGPPMVLGGHVFEPWQIGFIVVGLPGLLMAVLLALGMPEPPRRNLTMSAAQPVSHAVGFLKRRRRLALGLAAGISCLTAVAYAGLAWLPTWFVRHYGWTSAQAGTTLGSLIIVAGTAGVVCGGLLAMTLQRRGYADAPLRAAAFISFAACPTGVAVFVMPDASLATAALAIYVFIASSFPGLGPSAVQQVTPNELRGQMSALMLMSTNLVGIALGPLFVAVLTTLVFRSDSALGLSLAITIALFSLVGAISLWRVLPAMREAVVGAGHQAAAQSRT